MDSASLLPSDPRRRLPVWPPYVAQGDDDEEIIEADDLIMRPAEQAQASDWVAWDNGERTPPWREEERVRAPHREAADERERVVRSGEIYSDYGPPPAREPRHRPLIALTSNSWGYHLFISHEAKKVLVRVGLILLAVLMMLLWGDLAQAVELFFSIFVL